MELWHCGVGKEKFLIDFVIYHEVVATQGFVTVNVTDRSILINFLLGNIYQSVKQKTFLFLFYKMKWTFNKDKSEEEKIYLGEFRRWFKVVFMTTNPMNFQFQLKLKYGQEKSDRKLL